jgi:hypothetical protein
MHKICFLQTQCTRNHEFALRKITSFYEVDAMLIISEIEREKNIITRNH